MSPRTPEQFEKIRGKKRQLIMDAALKVISEKGYHGTSISAIAKESGVSKGLMYNYFSSKEDLLIEIISEGFVKIFEEFSIDKSLCAEDNLIRIIETTFDVMEEMRETFRIYFSILMKNDVFDLVKDKLNEVVEPIMGDYAALMARLGYEKPLEEAFFLRFVLDGIGLNYVLFPEEFPKEYCIERFKQIYLSEK
jgi:AcrR family transcriptional regulator